MDDLSAWTARAQAGMHRAAFDAASHPRAPAGAAAGGQFVSANAEKGEAGGGTASKDKQDQVRAVQKLLGVKVTGSFSPADAAALRRYQKAHGLVVDGVAGGQTVAALLGEGKRKPGPMTAADRQKLLDVVRGHKPAKKTSHAKTTTKQKTGAAKATGTQQKAAAAKTGSQQKAAARPPAKAAARAESPAPHPGAAARLHEYWVHGKGAAQIRWGTHGDFDRCTRLLMEHAHFTPDQAHGYCNLAHHAALGIYPATHAAAEKGHGRRMSQVSYFRSFPVEEMRRMTAADGAPDGRTVEAYAAVFDSPAEIRDGEGHYREVIDRTAFNKTLSDARRDGGAWRVGCFYNHGMSIHGTPEGQFSLPLGTPVHIEATSRGLLTRTRYAKTELADQVLELIDSGAITAQSFTGRIVRSDPGRPVGGKYRPGRGTGLPMVRRMELGLREYGPTPFPAYADAAVLGVRASLLYEFDLDEDEFEDLTDSDTPSGAVSRAGEPLVEHSEGHHLHALFRLRTQERLAAAGLVLPTERKG